MGRDVEPIHDWDSDHTALVHVLWEAERKGLTVRDADELASLIMGSRWLRAVRQHARGAAPSGGAGVDEAAAVEASAIRVPDARP